MQRFRFPLAVAVASITLVTGVLVVGGIFVGSALASSPLGAFGPGHAGPPWTWAGDNGGWQGAAIPPELAGLKDVPASERFSHFRGAQVLLTDRDGKPVTLSVTPGTATAVSQTSLTITANDGSPRTYTLDASTAIHGKRGAVNNQAAIAQNDSVVVITINGSSTATAVVAFDPNGFGPWGPFGH